MIRFLTGGALVVWMLGALGVAQPQQPIFRGAGDVVRVFATVTDRDGRLVTTLDPDDFEMRDEGKPQPITLFDNTPQPIRLIVMLDVSGSMEGNLPLLRAAAEQLVRAAAPRRSRARRHVRARDHHQPDVHARSRRAARRAAVDRLRPTRRRRCGARSTRRWTPSTRDSDERRVVLVLSDGKDSGPIGFRQRFVSQAEVIDRARREDVMVYAIGMRSRGPRPIMPGIGPGGLQAALTADLPDPGLARVAEETGGGYTEIRFGQDLGAAFAQVADELHSQYLIGFAPPERDGKVHEIEVASRKRAEAARAKELRCAPRLKIGDLVTDPAVTYASYLKIDELLTLQQPRSQGPEHDELLFIVIHQVYELWFKELLHELDHVRQLLDDEEPHRAQHTLKRILTILKVMVAQLDILETMTPLEFLTFRERLEAASGFQSDQFRQIEFLLGVKSQAAIRRFPEGSRARTALERRYQEPTSGTRSCAICRRKGTPCRPRISNAMWSRPIEPSAEVQRILVDGVRGDTKNAELCERLVDLDEGIQEWRYRHVKMVERTIGAKSGTGGSAGAAYLQRNRRAADFSGPLADPVAVVAPWTISPRTTPGFVSPSGCC